jgi:hypothetical protein
MHVCCCTIAYSDNMSLMNTSKWYSKWVKSYVKRKDIVMHRSEREQITSFFLFLFFLFLLLLFCHRVSSVLHFLIYWCILFTLDKYMSYLAFLFFWEFWQRRNRETVTQDVTLSTCIREGQVRISAGVASVLPGVSLRFILSLLSNAGIVLEIRPPPLASAPFWNSFVTSCNQSSLYTLWSYFQRR